MTPEELLRHNYVMTKLETGVNKIREQMLALAQDPGSELYLDGFQRTGAGLRCAFWDGYNGVTPSPHVIPGTPSAACAAAGRDLRRQHRREGRDPVPRRGRGRPPLPREQALTAYIRERVSPGDRATYDQLGGKPWLLGALKRARSARGL